MDNHVRTVTHVNFAAATAAMEAGIAKARELGINVGIVVTDANGDIVTAGRMDGANPRAWKGGHGKAHAAVSVARNRGPTAFHAAAA